MGKYHCNIASCKDTSVRYLSHNVVKAGCSFVCHEKKMMLWTGSDASVVDAVGEFEAQRFLQTCGCLQMSVLASKCHGRFQSQDLIVMQVPSF